MLAELCGRSYHARERREQAGSNLFKRSDSNRIFARDRRKASSATLAIA